MDEERNLGKLCFPRESQIPLLQTACERLDTDILHILYEYVYAYHIAEQKARWSLVHAELLSCQKRTPSIQDRCRGRIMSGLRGLWFSN